LFPDCGLPVFPWGFLMVAWSMTSEAKCIWTTDIFLLVLACGYLRQSDRARHVVLGHEVGLCGTICRFLAQLCSNCTFSVGNDNPGTEFLSNVNNGERADQTNSDSGSGRVERCHFLHSTTTLTKASNGLSTTRTGGLRRRNCQEDQTWLLGSTGTRTHE